MAKSDPIKEWIASEIQASAKMFERRGIFADGVLDVTASEISHLETQIRVKTQSQGTRYFVIKVSEVH